MDSGQWLPLTSAYRLQPANYSQLILIFALCLSLENFFIHSPCFTAG